MKKTDIAYMAGLFDGEGTVGIQKQKSKTSKAGYTYVMRVRLAISDRWIIEWFRMAWGGNVHFRKPSKIGWLTIWVWQVNGKNAIDFLTAIKPYAILKQSQIEVALRFQERRWKKVIRGRHKTEEELALDEVDKILCFELKHNQLVRG